MAQGACVKWFDQVVRFLNAKEPRSELKSLDDVSLMACVRRGGRVRDEAFEILHDRYREELWRFIRSRNVSEHDGEDVLQRVMMGLLKYLERETPTRFLPIAIQKTKWEIATHFEQYQKRDWERLSLEQMSAQRIEPMVPAPSGEPGNLVSFRALAAGAGLSDVQEEALILHYFVGFSVKEVALITEVSENVVKGRMRLAKLKLRGISGREDAQ